MPIDPTAYGVVYGTGLTGQQMVDNLAALADACDAAILAGDYVAIPANTTIEVCAQSSTDDDDEAVAVQVTRAGVLEVRGGSQTTSIIDWHIDYSNSDGGAITPTKERRTTRVEEMTTKATRTGTSIVLTKVGGTNMTLTDNTPGTNFVTAGVRVGDSMTMSGWPSSANNTAPASGVNPAARRLITEVGTNYVKYTHAQGVAQTGDADSSYTVGTAYDQHYAHLFRSLTPGVSWVLQDLRLQGYESYAAGDFPDAGAEHSVIWHVSTPASVTSAADYGQNDITLLRVTTADDWTAPFTQTYGGNITTLTSCTIKGSSPLIGSHDAKSSAGGYPSSGRAVRATSTVFDCIPVLAEDASDDVARGSAIYAAPHVEVTCTSVTFKNCIGTASRQYSSSDEYTDFGSILPNASDYTDCTWTNDHADLVGYTGGHQAIITSDAPVTCTITRPQFLKGNAAVCGQLMARCSTTIVTDPVWQNGGLKAVDLTSRRQDSCTISITGGSTTEGRTGGVTHPSDAGWFLTFTGHAFTVTAPDDTNVLIEGPEEADGDQPTGSLTIGTGCTFVNSSATADTCYAIRVSENAPVTVASGVTFSGPFRAAVYLPQPADTSSPWERDVTLNAVDFSGITGAGRALFMIGAGGNNLAAGSLSGTGNVFNDTASTGGIRYNTVTPGAQQLRGANSLDPTTRTASSGLVKLSPNHRAATITGTVSSAQIGLGTAQDSTYAFDGQEMVWVSGAALTASAGGSITWLTTGARTAGSYVYVTYSSGTWTETQPQVTIAATDDSATEPAASDTGIFTFTRTASTALALTVNLTIGGTATNGTDYTEVATTLQIAAGSATGTLTVTPLLDFFDEAAETVTVTIAAGGYTIGGAGSATVTIANTAVPGATQGPAQKSMAEVLASTPPTSFVVNTAKALFKPVAGLSFNPWRKR